MPRYTSGQTFEVKPGSQLEEVDGLVPGWYAQWDEDMVDGPVEGPFPSEADALAATFHAD